MMHGPAISVSQIIDDGRWSSAQKIATLFAACAITLDGLDIQVLSFAVPAIATEWHIAKSAFALVFATSLLAVALGTLAGGFIGDRLGRRKTIAVAVLWFGVGTVLLSTSQSLPALFFYRLLSGLGIGAALPNATAYLAEITPARMRTTLLSSVIVCIPLGGVVGGVIAAHVLPVYGWRTLILLGGVLPIALALPLFVVLPESPRFLAARGRSAEALAILIRRFGFNLPPDTKAVESDATKQDTSLSILLTEAYRRDTVSLWLAFCFCLISIYMVFNWLPSVLTNLRLSPAAASNDLAMYNLCGIIGTLLLGTWINRRGSRLPMIVASVAGIATALWLALSIGALPDVSALLRWQIGLHGFFVNGVQTVLYALAAHLYPTRLRASGVAAASGFGRAGAMLSAFLGGSALHYASPVYFSILAVSMTGTLLSILFLRNHIPAKVEDAHRP